MDCADRFTAEREPDSRTAEAWMRSVLEDAPAPQRGFVRCLEWTTRVRYGHPAARWVWSIVRLVHVLVVPYVLRRV